MVGVGLLPTMVMVRQPRRRGKGSHLPPWVSLHVKDPAEKDGSVGNLRQNKYMWNETLNGGVWVISGYFRMISAKPGAWIYLLILLNLLISLKVEGSDVPLILVQDAVAKGAVCLDGSPPAYHFAPGFGSGVNNWLVHMEGGGWCSNVEECKERTDNFRGSSKYMKQLSFSGILGSKQNLSPDFYNWNKVKIRYCDGSSFTGDIEAVNPATNLYFRGARVWRAVMDELLAKGMNEAQNALLSGCSAGGLASILHCDSFRDLLPAGARVKCFSDAGYFINAKDVSGKESIKDFYSQVVTMHGSAKNLPSSCTSRFPPSMCFFPQYVVQSMRTPLFILNAAYDAWQIRNILAPSPSDPSKVWGECKLDIKKCSSSQLQVLQDFRSEFLRALPANSPSIGMFIDSCYSHCQSGAQETWLSSNSPAIDETSIAKAVGDWFYGRSAVQKIDCPYPCNPTCHNREID